MMYDETFLKQLDYNPVKEVYIKLISLTQDEFPREEIIGRATGGSVNVDGASAVRRTCSLTMVALEDDVMITDSFWSYKNRFKLEIGVRNIIDKNYPDIIWFNMGVYVITSFNASRSTTAISVSISGKDKMCLLNGEVGGVINSSVDFGTEEIVDYTETGEIITRIEKLPIYRIIQEMVKTYGQEKANNIIINDLNENSYDLWEYQGDAPMYLFFDQGKKAINMTLNGDTEVQIQLGKNEYATTTLSGFEENGYKFYSTNTLDANYNKDATIVRYYDQYECYVVKVRNGETAGYHSVPLTYNGTLISSAGSSVTSVLDKIKSMLGNYEYFYDLNGKFVFQRQNTFMQELFSPISGGAITPTAIETQYEYKFEDRQLFTQISKATNINNIKNDFTVWGTRREGKKPIHARYAVDKKPEKYVSAWGRYVKLELAYCKFEKVNGVGKNNYTEYYAYKNQTFQILDEYDDNWHYYKLDRVAVKTTGYDIYQIVGRNQYKKYVPTETIYYKPYAEKVYYEAEFGKDQLPYYTYLKEGQSYYAKNVDNLVEVELYDWRELIYQMALDFYAHNQDTDYLIKLEQANPQFISGTTGYEQYYIDLQGFWRQLYSPNPTEKELGDYDYYKKNETNDPTDNYWNKLIHQDPNQLLFWFDFLDTKGEINKCSIKNIGDRPKVVNENTVTSIYYKETPEVLFIVSPQESIGDITGTANMPIWIQDNMETLFYKSAQGIAATSRINTLLEQHITQAETITLNSVPIYYLQPNTRIYVDGYGDYKLTKISYSLTYNGTMNISGSKIVDQVY